MEQRTNYATRKEIWIATLPSLARNDGWSSSLQEKRHFGTSGPLRFKKNDDFRQETFVKWIFLHIYRNGYGCSLFLLKD